MMRHFLSSLSLPSPLGYLIISIAIANHTLSTNYTHINSLLSFASIHFLNVSLFPSRTACEMQYMLKPSSLSSVSHFLHVYMMFESMLFSPIFFLLFIIYNMYICCEMSTHTHSHSIRERRKYICELESRLTNLDSVNNCMRYSTKKGGKILLVDARASGGEIGENERLCRQEATVLSRRWTRFVELLKWSW